MVVKPPRCAFLVGQYIGLLEFVEWLTAAG
jgi:hypothetical protein